MKYENKTLEELNKMSPNELIELITNRFPTAYHTVDMAIVRTGKNGMPEVLLIRKQNNLDEKTLFQDYSKLKKQMGTNPTAVEMSQKQLNDMLANFWRFPGGFVDPSDVSAEKAALREAYEETHMMCDNPSYIGSVKVNDGRYIDTPHRIITSFFELKHRAGDAGQGFDDVVESRWFPIPALVNLDLKHPIHADLFDMLDQRYKFHRIAYEMMEEFSDKTGEAREGLNDLKEKFEEKWSDLNNTIDKVVPELKSSAHELIGKVAHAGMNFMNKMKEFVDKA